MTIDATSIFDQILYGFFYFGGGCFRFPRSQAPTRPIVSNKTPTTIRATGGDSHHSPPPNSSSPTSVNTSLASMGLPVIVVVFACGRGGTRFMLITYGSKFYYGSNFYYHAKVACNTSW